MNAESCFSSLCTLFAFMLLHLCRELCEAVDLIFISHFISLLSYFLYLVCIYTSRFLILFDSEWFLTVYLSV